MSTLSFPTDHPVSRPGGVLRHIGELVGSAIRELRNRRAGRAMSLLSDDMLHDIGVSRSEIDEVVRHGRSPRRS